MRRLAILLSAALGALSIPTPSTAQCAAGDTSDLTIATVLKQCPQVARLAFGLSESETRAALLSTIMDPVTLNRGLAELDRTGVLNGLLRDLNLRFVNLQQGDRPTVLGVTYDWAKDLKHDTLSSKGHAQRTIGMHFTTAARGTIALRKDLNPRDFLDSKASLALFGSFGGVVPGKDAFEELNRLEDVLATFQTLDALERSPEFRNFFGTIWSRLSTQTYLTISANVGLEADQTFVSKQWAYGLNAGFDVKAWNPQSLLAQWNVFDWPAALLRYLLGSEKDFRPSGAAIPTLIVGLDRVDPTGNAARASIAGLDPYTRVRAEVAYRSMLLSLANGPVSAEAGWRYFRELGAPLAVRMADLQSSSYVHIAITAPNGMYAAWSHGRLPFDRQDDQVYELGFQTHF